MPSIEIQKAMHYYVDLGLPVIPLCPSGSAHAKVSEAHKRLCKCDGKVPLIAGWQTRQETTEEHLEQWMAQFKDMNIGLPLGEASGYCGIDVDGSEGEILLQQMSGGDLPDTWEYNTGAGRRLLYRIPVGIPTKKYKQTGTGAHQECAILCTGQQTAVPPSVHHTGRTYIWLPQKSPYDIDCAMAPAWLIKTIKVEKAALGTDIRATSIIPVYAVDMMQLEREFEFEVFDETIPSDLCSMTAVEVKGKQKASAGFNESTLFQPITEGSRDNTLTQIIGYMLSKEEYRNMPKEMFTQFMYSYNNTYCDPPLDDTSIITKVNYFWEIEAQKSAGYKSAAKTSRDWNITEVVTMVMNKLEDEGIMIKYDQAKESFYFCYKSIGPWVEDCETYVKSKMWQYLKDTQSGDESWGSQHKLREALEAIMLELVAKGYSKRQMFDLNVHKEELSKYLVIDGKLLDWRNSKLYPWDPNYNSTVNFKINFDAEADCPNWKSYMEEWLPDESMRNLLQEFMGSCLLPEAAPEEKFIILTGHGSNGKSMFLKGMKMIFKDYSISLTPQKLAERFGPSSLYGKLLNICSEIEGEGGYIKNTAQLKAIVSGEALTAEYKGQDAFQFEPVANLIFSCNTVPKSRDKSYGWYRRQLIIPFDREFVANSVTGQLMEDNMRKELPGIFNWLLEGLRRIKLRGHFHVSTVLKQVQADFKAVNDPMEGFIKDCLIPLDPNTLSAKHQKAGAVVGVSTEVIRELYYCWCRYSYGDKDISYRKSDRNFNQEMELRGYAKARGLCHIRDLRTAVFLGIDIELTNYELGEVIEDMHMGSSVTEVGFHLHALAKKLRTDEAQSIESVS